MSKPMRAAILRIFILLLLVCVGAFAWESARNAKMQPVTGQVLGTVYKGYIIGYKVQGQSYQLETRIGVMDALTGLGLLTAGATVPILVDPEQPYVALINTGNGRYGITLAFVFLLLIFMLVVLLSAMKTRLAARGQ